MNAQTGALLKLQAAALAQYPHVRDGERDPSEATEGLIAHAGELGLAADDDNALHVIHEGLEGRRVISAPPPPIAINYRDFLAKQFPPREAMLSPWLPMQGLTMIHAPRGVGKTHVALGVAWAVATGRGFFNWEAVNGARRVLLLDGEMPCTLIQERLARVTGRSQYEPPLPEYFQIAAADMCPEGLPDIANLEAQEKFYKPLVETADLVLVDNLSTLCTSVKENDADSFAPMQAWLLSMRRMGKSVVLFHHDGKGGQQRGTSKKEDPLDTVIGLRRPFDYTSGQGARFEVHFEKTRGFFGTEAEPFEAWLQGDTWAINPVKAGDDLETLKAMKAGGMGVREIAERTGMSKSTVARHLNSDCPMGHS